MRVISYPETQFIKKSTHYILVSILTIASFVHANAQVAISGTDDSESSVTTFDDKGMTSQPEDSIDYASLEQANQGSSSSSDSWTIGDDLAAVVGAVAIVAGAYYGHRYYNAAAEDTSGSRQQNNNNRITIIGDASTENRFINGRGNSDPSFLEPVTNATFDTEGVPLTANDGTVYTENQRLIMKTILQKNQDLVKIEVPVNEVSREHNKLITSFLKYPKYIESQYEDLYEQIKAAQSASQPELLLNKEPNPADPSQICQLRADGVPIKSSQGWEYSEQQQNYILENIIKNTSLSDRDKQDILNVLKHGPSMVNESGWNSMVLYITNYTRK